MSPYSDYCPAVYSTQLGTVRKWYDLTKKKLAKCLKKSDSSNLPTPAVHPTQELALNDMMCIPRLQELHLLIVRALIQDQ